MILTNLPNGNKKLEGTIELDYQNVDTGMVLTCNSGKQISTINLSSEEVNMIVENWKRINEKE